MKVDNPSNILYFTEHQFLYTGDIPISDYPSTFDSLRSTARPAWLRYSIAVPAVLCGVLLRWMFMSYLPAAAPFQTFVVSVLIAAWYGGFGPGMVACALSLLVADYYYIAPVGTFAMDPLNATRMLIFSGLSVLFSVLGAFAHKSREGQLAATQALKMSEERFSMAFTASPHGMALYNSHRHIFTMVNLRFGEILGYHFSDVQGKDWTEFPPFVTGVDGESFGDILRHEQRLLNHTLRVPNKEGVPVVISLSLEPIMLQDERVFIVNIDDITERRSAHDAVAESERKYREIVEGTNAMLFTSDARGRFTYLNDSAAYVLGYRPREMVGRFYLRFVHPDDRAWVHGVYTRQMGRQQETSYMEFRYIARGGAEGWLSFSVSPVLNGNTVVGLSGVAQEISRRKKTESALRASEEQHRLLFETMNQGVTYLDETGKVTMANPAAADILGMRESDIMGTIAGHSRIKTIREDGTEMPVAETPSLLALREGREVRNVRMGLVVGHPDRVRWLEVSAVPQFRDGKAQPYRVYVTFSDITAQREAEEQIRKLNTELEERVLQRTEQLSSANKELESFSYSISHDLRAPLRAINGYSRILAEEHAARLDDEGRRLLDIIAASARQMGQLIDDLLTFSRLNRGAMIKRIVDVGALVTAVVHEQEEAELPRVVDVSIGELGFPPADPSLLRQAWVNLVGNAFKFTRLVDKPSIQISSRMENGFMVYSVKDNGAGFDMDYQEKLFGVFQRLHSAEEFEGTGIGLALVQRIVHRHGGKVWAEGEVGKGATFYFSLPVD